KRRRKAWGSSGSGSRFIIFQFVLEKYIWIGRLLTQRRIVTQWRPNVVIRVQNVPALILRETVCRRSWWVIKIEVVGCLRAALPAGEVWFGWTRIVGIASSIGALPVKYREVDRHPIDGYIGIQLFVPWSQRIC